MHIRLVINEIIENRVNPQIIVVYVSFCKLNFQYWTLYQEHKELSKNTPHTTTLGDNKSLEKTTMLRHKSANRLIINKNKYKISPHM